MTLNPFLILILFVSALFAQTSKSEVAQSTTLKIAQKSPFFAVNMLKDPFQVVQSQVLFETAQKEGYERVALVWFATWCVPCLAGLKEIQAHNNELKSAKTQIILVNYREKPELIRAFLEAQNLSFDVVILDKMGGMAAKFGFAKAGETMKLPKTVLISQNQKILGMWSEEGQDYLNLLKGQ